MKCFGKLFERGGAAMIAFFVLFVLALVMAGCSNSSSPAAPDVSTPVDAATGQVTIVAEGTATITATVSDNATCSYAQANSSECLRFESGGHFYNHPTKDLHISSKTTTCECYMRMFMGCVNLKRAPELLAAKLSGYCYASMFEGCSELTEDCYNQMFQGCSTLANVCCFATDISAENCTTNWLNGVKSTGMFVRAKTMDGWTEYDDY